MPESLPLYDSLISECKSKPLSVKNKKYITNSISTLDERKKELVYILIDHYSKIKSKNDLIHEKIENPDGTTNISYDLNKLPNILGQLILKFLERDEQVNNYTTSRSVTK